MKQLIIILLLTLSSVIYAADISEYLSDADRYIQNRDYKAAIIQLKNALQQKPKNVDARLKLGSVYLKIGNGPAAEKEYRKAKKNGANIERWMPKLAEALLIQNRGADLLRDIDVRNEMSSYVKADILGKRGQAYLMINDVESATKSFDSALALNKNNTFALLGSARIFASQQELEKATEQVDLVLKNSPKNIIALNFRAQIAYQTKDLILAKSTYQKALGVYSRHIPTLLGMANIHMALKEYLEAEKFADQIIAINREIPMPYYIKALGDINNKDLKNAETNLQKVLSMQSNHLPSLLIMGRIQYTKGNYEQAEKRLRDFTNKVPRHLPAIKLLGATRLKLKDVDGARKILVQGEALDENDADLLSLLGMVYSQSGKISKGSEYFERAAKISPEKANIQTQLGLSYLAGGDLDQAVSVLENAIKLDKDFERADVMLILTHLRKKDYDNALKAAKAYAKKQPKNPAAYNFQGAAYSGKGDDKKARNAFEKALKIKSGFSVAELNLARLDVKEKKYKSAEKRFKNVISYENKNVKAYLGLAKLLLEQGEKEKSLKWVKEILHKQPKAIQPSIVLNRFYLADNQPVKALDVAQNMAAINPSSSIVLEMLARTQIANDKIDEAVSSYKMIAELNPNNSNAHYNLALAYLKNKNKKQAIMSFDRVLLLDDKHIGVLSSYAMYEIKERLYKPALARAIKLKKEYKNKAVGWMVEGEIYMAQKKYKRAIKAFQKAHKKEKNNRGVHKLAKAFEKSGDYESGILILKNWLRENEKDLSSHILLAQLFQSFNQNQNAAESYLAVLRLQPDNVVALNNISWIYSGLENKRAIEYGKRAYELAPNNPSIADTYGWALVKVGDIDRGLNMLKQASVQAPHIGDIKYHIAYALYKKNDIPRAVKELKRLLAIQEFKSHKNAKMLLKKIESN